MAINSMFFMFTKQLSAGDTLDNHTSQVVFRDAVQVSRRGFAIVRFQAKNPGLWLFHCHIIWHLDSGMAMIIDVI
ncbi:hypothetical protein N7504_003922 [Penicillium tannophilum]|nr:hypothetical protein N7504_003922 [Penicillium tannophilum]